MLSGNLIAIVKMWFIKLLGEKETWEFLVSSGPLFQYRAASLEISVGHSFTSSAIDVRLCRRGKTKWPSDWKNKVERSGAGGPSRLEWILSMDVTMSLSKLICIGSVM